MKLMIQTKTVVRRRGMMDQDAEIKRMRSRQKIWIESYYNKSELNFYLRKTKRSKIN